MEQSNNEGYNKFKLVNSTDYYEYDEDLYSNTLYDLLYFKVLSLNEVEIYFNTLEKRIFACKKISKIDDTNSYNFFNKRIDYERG